MPRPHVCPRPAALPALWALVALATLAGCAEIPVPGVRLGTTVLRRQLVCEPEGIGAIQTIERLPIVPDDGAALWVGGELGCVRVTSDGALRGMVAFDRRLLNPAPLDVDGDGAWETIDRGEGWCTVALLDESGGTEWFYTRGRPMVRAPDAMAAGPVGEDGALGFVVGMNADGGLRFLDLEGQLVGRVKATNVFSVAVADLDGDGQPEILHSDCGGEDSIRVRDLQRAELRRLETDFVQFSLIPWPRAQGPLCLLGLEGRRVQIVDPCVEYEGRPLAEFELPDEGLGDLSGVLLTPATGAAPWLVLTRTIRATWKRSALYVFDSKGALIYHELFPVADVGLAVVPAAGVLSASSGDGDVERAQELLIGIGTELWRYSPLPQAQPAPQATAR